jgi:archaellum component FlaF (FlaF/FlaG flagellin family)
MTLKQRANRNVLAVIVTGLVVSLGPQPGLAEEGETSQNLPAPAGQRCPEGSYVVGFDEKANIICSPTAGSVVSASAEPPVEEKVAAAPAAIVVDDTPDPAAAAVRVEEKAEPTVSTNTTAPAVAAGLTITDVEPSSVVYGTSEVTVTVNGTGFNRSSVIIFEGESYGPTVNDAGTQLRVTLPTGKLIIGRYPIKVSNGEGEVVTRKKGVVIF